MPEGMEQPYNGDENPLTLVCQFCLGEGIVYVFADLDYFFGDTDADDGHLGEWEQRFYRVLYSPTREDLHEHAIRYADGTSAVPEAQAPDAPAMRGEESYILHTPTVWQDELAQDYPGYDVLLQLDESEEIGLRFYDCGTLFFLIKPEDLEARRFDDVRCVLYSY